MHYWADLQSVHGFRCYDNIALNVKCELVLALALCLVIIIIIDVAITIYTANPGKCGHTCRNATANFLSELPQFAYLFKTNESV